MDTEQAQRKAVERLEHVQYYLDWTRLATKQCVELNPPDDRVSEAHDLLERVAALVIAAYGDALRARDEDSEKERQG